MGRKPGKPLSVPSVISGSGYYDVLADISELVEQARRVAAEAINSVLAATYWEVGRRIVELEQGGKARAEYGEGLVKRLSADLTAKHGRGFSRRNLEQMRAFYQGWKIWQTPSAIFQARVKGSILTAHQGLEKAQTVSALPAPPKVSLLGAVCPKENLTMPDEADPVGLILCSDKDDAVVRYAMGGIQAQVFASKYLAKLPPAEAVRHELLATKLSLESKAALHDNTPTKLARAVLTKGKRRSRRRTD